MLRLRMGGFRIGNYTSVPSRVVTFKQVDIINAPLDLVTNRIGAMLGGAVK